ncbi:hypothetical protein EP56_05515 [Listeriaceae bacterium FSL A5-0209]|nr:hypothetical protein EP56_05515 [Listeriaceae bacterium FSL A5-0209]
MSEKMGQQVIHCSNCGENKVKYLYSPASLASYIGLALIIVGAWIPLLGWFIMIPLGFISFIVAICLIPNKKRYFKCKSCKHTFSTNKEIYTEYRQAIK